MLAPSSPIAFPPDTQLENGNSNSNGTGTTSKRSRHDHPKPPQLRVSSGFVDDDSDDDVVAEERSPKRPRQEHPVTAKPRQDDPKPAKPRVFAGFINDDDSDDSEDDVVAQDPSLEQSMTSCSNVAKPRLLAGFVQDNDSGNNGVAERSSHEPRMTDHPIRAVKGNTDTPLAALNAEEVITTPPDSQLHEGSDDEAQRCERLFGGLSSTFSLLSRLPEPATYQLSTCTGKAMPIRERQAAPAVSYKTMVAARSRTKEGRAKREFYGIDIHNLVDSAKKEIDEARMEVTATPITPPANQDEPVPPVEPQNEKPRKQKRTLLWTEKYRARTFMDLVGDDLTNRQVLRYLKHWDPIVFPHTAKKKKLLRRPGQQDQPQDEEKPHRKILMLTGPPGLGKTTLAHVCAKQAGYEVMEINASDDRSKDVVKGRIRTSLGTESVKTVENKKSQPGKQAKVARPVCVVVDEVDGAVGGSGGSGEGGFVKELINLVLLDQKNSAGAGAGSGGARRKKKTDDFRQMRPLILICNDVYHPSLRPLRQSGLAEIIHVGKPSLDAVVTRLKSVFEKEGIPCEKEAARRLCESAWGMTSGIDAKKGSEGNAEGDLRGVMVVGEWVAGRLKAAYTGTTPTLTRSWVDAHIVQGLAHGGGGARGLGRGGTREIVNRIFQEGAGFPKQAATYTANKKTRHELPQAQLGFAEQHKKYAMDRLREMVETNGEADRIMSGIFAEYPSRDFNDDCFLTKPNIAYEWMHFHDMCSARLFGSQEWELVPYASQPILACHHLFASPRRHQAATTNNSEPKWGESAAEARPLPFTGPRADFEAHETEKVNRATLQGIQSQLPPHLYRSFRSPEDLATDFLPFLSRLVSPDVKPVIVGGSDKSGSIASVRREAEKAMVRRAALVLAEVGIELHKGRIEDANAGPTARPQFVYRMEPDIDALSTFETASTLTLTSQAPTRYAVRQCLEQELQRALAQRENAARQARLRMGGEVDPLYVFDEKDYLSRKKNKNNADVDGVPGPEVKRDFFGRIIMERLDEDGKRKKEEVPHKVWVTYHEGINNAVSKPISLEEFLRGF